MGWVNGRGAPRKMPYDATPLRTRQVDVRMRVAWLLRVTRMASPLGGTGKEFRQRLTEMGIDLDESGLSRRESGERELDADLIRAYEALLDLPEGHVLGVCDTLCGSLGGTTLFHPQDMSEVEVRREFERVCDVVRHGQASGGDWLSLANLLRQPGPVLPTYLRDEWTYRLLDEMARSTGGAYLPRISALTQLTGDRYGAASLIRVVEERLAEPGVQAVGDVIGLLGDGTDAGGTDLALRLLDGDSAKWRYLARGALVTRVADGNLTQPQAQRLARTVRRLAYDDEGSSEIAWDLARRLSPRLGADVASAVGRPPQAMPTVGRIEDPPELRRYVSAAQEVSDLDEDRMLERLLREALSDDFTERRFHASMLLMASPYAEALAATAVEVQTRSASAGARDAAAQLLTNLSKDVPASHFVGMLEAPDASVRSSSLMALAHGPGVPFDVDLRPHMLDARTRYEATYAAGMSAHPDLALAAAGRVGGDDVRQSAQWWAEHSGQFREPVGACA